MRVQLTPAMLYEVEPIVICFVFSVVIPQDMWKPVNHAWDKLLNSLLLSLFVSISSAKPEAEFVVAFHSPARGLEYCATAESMI